MEKVTIRRVDPKEHLNTLRWLADESGFASDLLPCTKTGAWWIASRGDQPVAFASAKLLVEDTTLYHTSVGVLPSARGAGLQRRLLRVREQWGRRSGATYAITYTHSRNPASQIQLIRQGYLPYTPANPWVGKEDRWVYWKKPLVPAP